MLKNIVEASLEDTEKVTILTDAKMETEGLELGSDQESAESDSEMSDGVQ